MASQPKAFVPQFRISVSCMVVLRFHPPVIVAPRVIRADNHAREGRAYRERAILQAAARVWAEGVAWETALELTRKALEPRAKGKGKGKGKGKRP